ncbi:hypothetical protein L5220_07960 [Synechococcus sp. PCC 6716]|nr:hypothetical protein [Synechococcus sp. PCC 6716]
MPYVDGQSATLEQVIGHLSPVEQIRMLMHHPYFTGRCPECRQPIHHSNVALGQCHCSHCGWHDQGSAVTAGLQEWQQD